MSSRKQFSFFNSRFINEENQNKASRVFWTVISVCSIGGMAFYGRDIVSKWMFDPDIIQITNYKNIREIPMPAVTICSPLLAQRTFIEYGKFYIDQETTKVLQELPSGEKKKLDALSQACFPRSYNYDDENVSETVKYLEEASLPANKKLLIYDHEFVDAADRFNRILTNHGICYSFNMLGYHSIFNSKTLSTDFNSYIRKGIKIGEKLLDDENEEVEWKVSSGYLTKDPQAFPHRIRKGFNDNTRFILILNKSDTINLFPVIENSYKIILHQPDEIPTEFHDYDFLSLEVRFVLSMKAHISRTDNSLAGYSPEIRSCYYQNEKKLKFFKKYSKEHCILECYANYTLKTCGCVRFYMPRAQDTPICRLSQSKCLTMVIQTWVESEAFNEGHSVLCKCLPACDRIKYEIKSLNALDFNEAKQSDSMIITQVQLKFEEFIVEERIKFASYSLEQLISDVGGLLGLFIGCSLLSIIELIYFCIKSCIKKRRNKIYEEKIRKHQNFSTRDVEFLKTLEMINEGVFVLPNSLCEP